LPFSVRWLRFVHICHAFRVTHTPFAHTPAIVAFTGLPWFAFTGYVARLRRSPRVCRCHLHTGTTALPTPRGRFFAHHVCFAPVPSPGRSRVTPHHVSHLPLPLPVTSHYRHTAGHVAFVAHLYLRTSFYTRLLPFAHTPGSHHILFYCPTWFLHIPPHLAPGHAVPPTLLRFKIALRLCRTGCLRRLLHGLVSAYRTWFCLRFAGCTPDTAYHTGRSRFRTRTPRFSHALRSACTLLPLVRTVSDATTTVTFPLRSWTRSLPRFRFHLPTLYSPPHTCTALLVCGCPGLLTVGSYTSFPGAACTSLHSPRIPWFGSATAVLFSGFTHSLPFHVYAHPPHCAVYTRTRFRHRCVYGFPAHRRFHYAHWTTCLYRTLHANHAPPRTGSFGHTPFCALYFTFTPRAHSRGHATALPTCTAAFTPAPHSLRTSTSAFTFFIAFVLVSSLVDSRARLRCILRFVACVYVAATTTASRVLHIPFVCCLVYSRLPHLRRAGSSALDAGYTIAPDCTWTLTAEHHFISGSYITPFFLRFACTPPFATRYYLVPSPFTLLPAFHTPPGLDTHTRCYMGRGFRFLHARCAMRWFAFPFRLHLPFSAPILHALLVRPVLYRLFSPSCLHAVRARNSVRFGFTHTTLPLLRTSIHTPPDSGRVFSSRTRFRTPRHAVRTRLTTYAHAACTAAPHMPRRMPRGSFAFSRIALSPAAFPHYRTLRTHAPHLDLFIFATAPWFSLHTHFRACHAWFATFHTTVPFSSPRADTTVSIACTTTRFCFRTYASFRCLGYGYVHRVLFTHCAHYRLPVSEPRTFRLHRRTTTVTVCLYTRTHLWLPFLFSPGSRSLHYTRTHTTAYRCLPPAASTSTLATCLLPPPPPGGLSDVIMAAFAHTDRSNNTTQHTYLTHTPHVCFVLICLRTTHARTHHVSFTTHARRSAHLTVLVLLPPRGHTPHRIHGLRFTRFTSHGSLTQDLDTRSRTPPVLTTLATRTCGYRYAPCRALGRSAHRDAARCLRTGSRLYRTRRASLLRLRPR